MSHSHQCFIISQLFVHHLDGSNHGGSTMVSQYMFSTYWSFKIIWCVEQMTVQPYSTCPSDYIWLLHWSKSRNYIHGSCLFAMNLPTTFSVSLFLGQWFGNNPFVLCIDLARLCTHGDENLAMADAIDILKNRTHACFIYFLLIQYVCRIIERTTTNTESVLGFFNHKT